MVIVSIRKLQIYNVKCGIILHVKDVIADQILANAMTLAGIIHLLTQLKI